MKPLFIVTALVGALATAGGALAYDSTGPNPSFEQIDQSEMRHVQAGWSPGNSSVRAERTRRSGNRVDSWPNAKIRGFLARDDWQDNWRNYY